ncbi:MAG: SpvB/TcaC N-terminal domain-containing protein, partial [Promethearchaeota archaeon]
MSNKSGVNNPAISIPKGGGAIKGIGETFQPDLFTGTGNFSVPIISTPGRNGFGPNLAIQYSTGSGNGPFGLGWGISIPRISRKTDKGIPEYNENDIFVMTGTEDLVPVLDEKSNLPLYINRENYTITRYQPRT